MKSAKIMAIALSSVTFATTIASSIAARAAIISPGDLGPPTVEESVGLPGAAPGDGIGDYKTQRAFGTVSGSFTSTDGGTVSGQATTSANQAVSVKLNLTAGADPVFGIGGKALAQLSYVMYINDLSNPTSQKNVNVNVNASGGATYTSSAPQELHTQIESMLLILGGQNNVGSIGFGKDLNKGSNNLNPDVYSFSFSTDQDYTFQTNTRYQVTLTDLVEGSAHHSATTTLTAFIDPLFTIDSSDPNLQLVFSGGMTNTPVTGGVPEPSTWAMMILGFCGLGLMVYRRRNDLELLAA